MSGCRVSGFRVPGFRLTLLFILISLLTACSGPHIHSSVQHKSISLLPDDLQNEGISFITPSSITGREEDRQSLALTFAEVLRKIRSDIRIVSLPETLGAINQANLSKDYQAMFEGYRETGIFRSDILRKIGEVTGTRFVAQLKLAGFSQGTQGRFGLFGWRLIETKRATIRVFMQIWDSREGAVAWEGVEEMSFADDTTSERNITFREVAEATASNLIRHIPYHQDKTLDNPETAKAEEVEEADQL